MSPKTTARLSVFAGLLAAIALAAARYAPVLASPLEWLPH